MSAVTKLCKNHSRAGLLVLTGQSLIIDSQSEVPGRLANGARGFAGWTLAEAFERCADPVLLEEQENAVRAWKQAGSPTRFLTLGHGRRAVDSADLRLEAAKENAGPRVIRAFYELLLSERLLSWGRRESPMAEPQPIPASAWNALGIVNYQNSILQERTPAKTRIFDVRVFPILHAPGLVERLADLPLIEVVQQYVLGDPEVMARGMKAIASDTAYDRVFKFGSWTPYGQRQWPLWISPTVVDDDSPTGALARPDPPDIAEALRALTDRVIALLAPLREGLIFAEGMPIRSRDLHRVPKAIWSHRDFAVDLEAGNVFRKNEQAESLRDLRVKRWSALMLSQATATPDSPEKSSRSRSATRLQNTLSAEQEAAAWLASQMRQYPDGCPSSKSTYRAEALKKWRKALSKRAFDKAWAGAESITEIATWSRPGRPRKSSQR